MCLCDVSQTKEPFGYGISAGSRIPKCQTSRVSHQPVLKYYNVHEEVTIQCDASEVGLGATLLQNGQPIAYASRALSKTEQCYAQIEKECLAIVFACERFDHYIYVKDCITVQSDHKPLETMLKNLSCQPQNDTRGCYFISRNTI